MKNDSYFFAILLFILSFNFYAQAPVNNDCSNAIEIIPNSNCNGTQASINAETTDSGVNDPGCGAYTGADIWYKLQMPATGGVKIVTSSGTITDNAMAVYTGSCDALTLYACNDDGYYNGDDLMAVYDVALPEGQIIYIRLWTYNGEETGNFTICAQEITPPPLATNDDCINATELIPDITCSDLKTGSNNATDSNVGLPTLGDCSDSYEGRDVWYKFIVPETGRFYIETSEDDGSITDTAMALYSGDCVSNTLTEISCNDDFGSNAFSKIEESYTSGETLYIRVWSFANLELGTFNICVSELPSLDVKDIYSSYFMIYPNPVGDIVNLKFNNIENSEIIVSLFDIQGKLVLNAQKKLYNKTAQLNVSSVESGLYFLKVNDGVKLQTKKLIIR